MRLFDIHGPTYSSHGFLSSNSGVTLVTDPSIVLHQIRHSAPLDRRVRSSTLTDRLARLYRFLWEIFYTDFQIYSISDENIKRRKGRRNDY